MDSLAYNYARPRTKRRNDSAQDRQRMNGGGHIKKFGVGRVPTGTPSLAWSSVVVVVSLLAGASIVHNIYKPDMTLPPVELANVGAGGDGNNKEN